MYFVTHAHKRPVENQSFPRAVCDANHVYFVTDLPLGHVQFVTQAYIDSYRLPIVVCPELLKRSEKVRIQDLAPGLSNTDTRHPDLRTPYMKMANRTTTSLGSMPKFGVLSASLRDKERAR